jgi:hypothetical protein
VIERLDADEAQTRIYYSIISNDASTLFYKHNFSSLMDKRRRHTRRIFLILNSQKKLLLTKHWQFRCLSGSIDWMTRPRARLRLTLLELAQSLRYRQRSGRQLGPGAVQFPCCVPAVQVRSARPE